MTREEEEEVTLELHDECIASELRYVYSNASAAHKFSRPAAAPDRVSLSVWLCPRALYSRIRNSIKREEDVSAV
jgi:hypothetical protein